MRIAKSQGTLRETSASSKVAPFEDLTRTHKDNLDGAAAPRLPKYFGKNGHSHTDPKSVKKNGHGKANWGELGSDDILDEEEFNFARQRRRSNSNSFSVPVRNFKTKFDVNDTEPVFEEDIHGPSDDELVVKDSENGSNASVEM